MSEPKPLVKLLADLIVEEFHLPIQAGKVRITEAQEQARLGTRLVKLDEQVF